MSIILFHELGHILAAFYFKWKIKKIVILPFGGLTIFEDVIDKSIYEEFIICISGPLFQILFYITVNNFINIKDIHYNLLIFNLLPLIPLDGSKLLNLFLNKILPFKISNLISIFVSYFLLCFLLFKYIFINYNLIIIITLSFLLLKTTSELKSHNYIFNRFLLEKFINPHKNNKIRYIKGLKIYNMYRNCNHIFIIDNKYYLEQEIIKKKFDLQGKVW